MTGNYSDMVHAIEVNTDGALSQTLHALSYPRVNTNITKDMNMPEETKQQPEWISTKDAMEILKVESTQAVRYLMDQYPSKFKKMNVGSKKQPRWVLWRADVVAFQKWREETGY